MFHSSTSLDYEPEMLQTFVKSIQISPSCSDEVAQEMISDFQKTIDSWKKEPNFYKIEISQSDLYKQIPPIIVEK